jgi:hypothetical protein
MALDLDTLQTAIHTAFKKAKDTPPPSAPGQAGQTQEQILTQLAADLSSAIDAFVKTGDVVQVTVQVTDPTNHVIGAGTQTGTGKIQ